MAMRCASIGRFVSVSLSISSILANSAKVELALSVSMARRHVLTAAIATVLDELHRSTPLRPYLTMKSFTYGPPGASWARFGQPGASWAPFELCLNPLRKDGRMGIQTKTKNQWSFRGGIKGGPHNNLYVGGTI